MAVHAGIATTEPPRAPRPITSACQSPIRANPGHQTSQLRRKVFGDVLHGQPIVADSVDGFDQLAHGVGQIRGCCCDGIGLSSHVKALSEFEITLAGRDRRMRPEPPSLRGEVPMVNSFIARHASVGFVSSCASGASHGALVARADAGS
jgi:hypothetical protein